MRICSMEFLGYNCYFCYQHQERQEEHTPPLGVSAVPGGSSFCCTDTCVQLRIHTSFIYNLSVIFVPSSLCRVLDVYWKNDHLSFPHFAFFAVLMFFSLGLNDGVLRGDSFHFHPSPSLF